MTDLERRALVTLEKVKKQLCWDPSTPLDKEISELIDELLVVKLME